MAHLRWEEPNCSLLCYTLFYFSSLLFYYTLLLYSTIIIYSGLYFWSLPCSLPSTLLHDPLYCFYFMQRNSILFHCLIIIAYLRVLLFAHLSSSSSFSLLLIYSFLFEGQWLSLYHKRSHYWSHCRPGSGPSIPGYGYPRAFGPVSERREEMQTKEERREVKRRKDKKR